MGIDALDNLVRINKLKAEVRDDAEVRRMLVQSRTRLADAQTAGISMDGRFVRIASWCFSASFIRLAGPRIAGGY